MKLPQLDYCKIRAFVSLLLAMHFVGCGVFGGASLDVGSSNSKRGEVAQPQMTLTIPEKSKLTPESKEQFLQLIDHTVKKLTTSKGIKREEISNLEKFSQALSEAETEEELYRSLKSNGEVKIKTVPEVLFTGYYKPLFKGSLKRTKSYSAPLYSLPKSKTTLTRKQLVTSGALKSNELIYLKDPFEAYLAEIQGSVGILLESGEIVHLAFAGSNNQKYVSIGTELLADGKLTKAEATIPGIRAYFESHPGMRQEYIHRNPRLVFFRKSAGKTLGSSGVELLAERSVATDPSVYPPGSILFTRVEIPAKKENGEWGKRNFSKFVIALDSGSAIKGSKRIDLYLGEGSDVGEVAGRVNSRGEVEVF